MTQSGRTCVKRGGDGAVTFDVLVQPRASRAKLGPLHDGRIKVAVTAPPVDGEANAALVEFLADALGVRKADVQLLDGDTSRRKRLAVRGVAPAEVMVRLRLP